MWGAKRTRYAPEEVAAAPATAGRVWQWSAHYIGSLPGQREVRDISRGRGDFYGEGDVL
jgi:hypothetical protein